jgi:heme oxygenase
MNEPRLAARLRDATHAVHRDAERSRFMRLLLQGQIDAPLYCRFLRNLHALYQSLEAELDRHAERSSLAPMRFPNLYRTMALSRDLDCLGGSAWTELPLAAATQGYLARIRQLSKARPALLAAHAYVRYMADLSGGQLLGDIVRQALSLQTEAGTWFYRFDGDPSEMKARFRAALDGLVLDRDSENAMIGEAQSAFARHLQLFDELVPAGNGRSALIDG